jgi:hypothetical protein
MPEVGDEVDLEHGLLRVERVDAQRIVRLRHIPVTDPAVTDPALTDPALTDAAPPSPAGEREEAVRG